MVCETNKNKKTKKSQENAMDTNIQKKNKTKNIVQNRFRNKTWEEQERI